MNEEMDRLRELAGMALIVNSAEYQEMVSLAEKLGVRMRASVRVVSFVPRKGDFAVASTKVVRAKKVTSWLERSQPE